MKPKVFRGRGGKIFLQKEKKYSIFFYSSEVDHITPLLLLLPDVCHNLYSYLHPAHIISLQPLVAYAIQSGIQHFPLAPLLYGFIAPS